MCVCSLMVYKEKTVIVAVAYTLFFFFFFQFNQAHQCFSEQSRLFLCITYMSKEVLSVSTAITSVILNFSQFISILFLFYTTTFTKTTTSIQNNHICLFYTIFQLNNQFFNYFFTFNFSGSLSSACLGFSVLCILPFPHLLRSTHKRIHVVSPLQSDLRPLFLNLTQPKPQCFSLAI